MGAMPPMFATLSVGFGAGCGEVTGEHLSADIQELLRLFHIHSVRYVIVGGEAVIRHGYPRLTGDIDLFYDTQPENISRLFAALREFWGGEVPAVERAAELAEPVVIQFGRPPNRIDLLSTLIGVTFAQAWRGRVSEKLVPRTGKPFPIHYIGLDQLLENKRRAGRHKDLDDFDQLSGVARQRTRRRRVGARRPKRKA